VNDALLACVRAADCIGESFWLQPSADGSTNNHAHYGSDSNTTPNFNATPDPNSSANIHASDNTHASTDTYTAIYSQPADRNEWAWEVCVCWQFA
jgi:hypothetical protein